MKICKHCGEENPDNKNWCKKCMKPLRDDPAEALPLSPEKETSDKTVKSGIIRKVPDDSAKSSKSEDGFDKAMEENHGRIYGSMASKSRKASEVKAEKEEPEPKNASGLTGRIGRKEYGKGEGSNGKNSRPKQWYCTRCSAPVDGEETLCQKCRDRKKKEKTICLRVVAALLVVAMWGGIAVHFVGNRTPKVKNAEQAISVLKDMGEEWGYENAFSELTEKNTTTIDGDTYYRLQQNYKGIPVYGRTVVYTAGQNGNVTSITSNIADVNSRIVLTPSVTKMGVYEAINAYAKEFLGSINDEGVSIPTFSDEDLVIYVLSEEHSALAYQLIAYIESEPYHIIVDANDANIYEVNSLIMTDSLPVEYKLTPNGKPLFLNVYNDNGEFSFYDDERNIMLYSAHGEKLVKYLAFYDSNDKVCFYYYPNLGKNGSWLDAAKNVIEEPFQKGSYAQYGFETVEQIKGATQVSSTSIFTLPDSAYQTMGYLVNMYEFLLEYLGRYGHANNNLMRLPVVYDCDNGSYAYTKRGMSMISLQTGVGLDVAAHEFMHCVEQNESDMTYSAESGAIMEALSDIFGELSEAYYYQRCDWLHDGGTRNIINPSLSTESNMPHPSVYMGDNWFNTSDSRDNGGVHINSTVISHAAYLMSNGGVYENDNKKIPYADLSKLWYRAMLKMPSDCNFVECRTLVELAASTMNLTDMQKQCVSEAFDAVGIPRASEEEYSELVHLFAKDETAVKGSVYEVKTVDGIETVVPVPKATVTVYDENSSKVYKKLNMKNKDGFFEIELPAGTYSVSITAEGYIGQTITVELNDNQVRYFSIAMKPIEEKAPTEAPTETPAKDNVLSGKCGDNLTWTLENGVLTISGTGAMYDYDPLNIPATPAPWYDYAYNNEVRAIQIGDGVTYIGSYAFTCCWNIDNIRIPGNVKEIGESAFENCCNNYDKKLNVVIENGVEIIGRGAFFQCFTMMPIELPDSITYIGDAAFFGCYLENITIPPNVKYIGDQLFVCDEDNHMEEIRFTGDAPVFVENTFLCTDAIAYYPANNKTWTPAIRKNYGGNITWIAEGDISESGEELVAYRPIVEKYNVSSQEQSYGWYSGILIDLDNDNVQELVLRYLSAPFADAWWSEYKLSVFDYENGKVVTKLDGVTFGEIGGAGEDAYATILYKSGKPYIMTYNDFGETSPGDSMKPNRVGMITIYDGQTCKETGVYRIERWDNVMSYQIDQRTVSEKEFVSEIEQYQGVEVICDLYQLIEFQKTFVTVSKLLQQMQ